MKSTHEGVALLVKFQAAFNFTERKIPPCAFFTFFNLHTWYQIAQSIIHEIFAFLPTFKRKSLSELLQQIRMPSCSHNMFECISNKFNFEILYTLYYFPGIFANLWHKDILIINSVFKFTTIHQRLVSFTVTFILHRWWYSC